MAHSNKGDFAYENTGDTLVEFFSKAGSRFSKRTFYHDEPTASVLDLFRPAWVTDNYKAMQLAMWLRDCRGGSGNRSGFRQVVEWVGKEHPEWIKANLHLIPEVGRWDDLVALSGTPCEEDAFNFWTKAIIEGHGLAAKWAPREKNNKEIYHKLRKIAKMSPKDFRKLLVKTTKVVESKMCTDKWYEIDYNKEVPSVAMARYNNAFGKHDSVRFSNWKDSLADPESGNEIKATVLYPHDVIRTLRADLADNFTCRNCYSYSTSGQMFADSVIANAQFKALPDYLEGTDQRIMSICDFSGSMSDPVSGSVQAIDVSMSLGLYCSDRLGENNPFYRRFIPFSDSSCLVDWRKDTFSVAAQKYNDGWCGSTNIRAALDRILDAAKLLNATNDQIPNVLLIISDMQWDQGTTGNLTSVEAAMKAWEDAGYMRPKILYWDLAGYDTAPARVNHKDVALVSGFSPSVLKAVLAAKDFSPMAVLEEAIAKYEVIDPRK